MAVFQSVEADAAGCEYALPENPVWMEETWHYLHWPTEDGYRPHRYSSGNFVVRKEVFDKIGGFDETLVTGEDAEIGLRLTAAGFRVFRAATELGMRTVAIYAQEDRLSVHRFKADEAYLVGENKGPVGAYLDIPGIVALAKEKGVDMIHPGYGFLAENAEFARACQKAGITFVGPRPDLLDLMAELETSA